MKPYQFYDQDGRLVAAVKTLGGAPTVTREAVRTAAAVEHMARALGDPLAFDGSLQSLSDAGAEVKGNIIHLRDRATGRLTPWQPLEVLVGDLPQDTARRGEWKAIRRSATAEYGQAFVKYLSAAVRHLDSDMALKLLSAAEQKALTEGTDAAGGFLVPPDMGSDILARLGQVSHFRARADVRTTTRDIYKLRRFAANTASGSLYTSDFVPGWAGETPAFSDVDPAFGSLDIPVKKAKVQTRLSRDLADDAPQLFGWLSTNAAQNMAVAEDVAFASGTGPIVVMGLLNSNPPITTVDVAQAANTLTNTTAAPGTWTKFIDLRNSLPQQYVRNAVWLGKWASEGAIRKNVDAQNHPLFPTEGQSADGFPLLLGFPFCPNDGVPAGGTAGNKALVIGDLKGFTIAVRNVLSMEILRERFADVDQLGVIISERIGGSVANPDAFRIGTT